MNIDKDDLYIYGLISGLIICSPFLGVYYGAKWIYNCLLYTSDAADE